MISGRVQGVGFRYYCVQMARQYGVRGWVRNSADGCVEVMAEGEDASLESFVCRCRHGPPSAKVLACRESYAKPTGTFDAFEVAF
ncbi:MAG: acylphosphatase [Verrucomicrobia bacterium]|nr:acylphosphatase [Verrucomicrobiota bacterium]MBU1733971.1 acylphosphatase [Verrucomicrobiota bacterium]MBU1856821.1 acylphosphatase [Verrucomicrobiota bacterium]